VDPLLEELHAIAGEAARRSLPYVVIGAFAVRTYLGRPDRRLTRDIDLLVATGGWPGFRRLLAERGYQVYEIGPWWRAERGTGPGATGIDIAIDRVVDMGTFESYPLDPRAAASRAESGGQPIPVPGIEDLLALKLLSHRDKDLLDVLALLLDAGESLSRDRFVDAIEARDLGIPVRRGYLLLRAEIESGALLGLWAQRFGKPLDPQRAAGALSICEALFR
jgi:hypothetical protein